MILLGVGLMIDGLVWKEIKMKVKIGNTVYDSLVEPIMLVLSDEDKFNISHMDTKATKYLSYPESMTKEEAREFMKL